MHGSGRSLAAGADRRRYRVFFRQIGLDPDEFNTPVEAAVLERLRAGGFKSHGLIDDAITIGTVETGVALRALDADRIDGVLGLRLAQPGNGLGEGHGLELPRTHLVLADDKAALGLIFGETAEDWEVAARRRGSRSARSQVQGVPEISIEEAIWSCVSTSAARKGSGAGSHRGVEAHSWTGFSCLETLDARTSISTEQFSEREPSSRRALRLRLRTDVDEAAARRSLRDQIASLERELAALFASAYPRRGLDWQVARPEARDCSDVATSRRFATTSPSRRGHAAASLRDSAYVERGNRDRIEAPDRRPSTVQVGADLQRGHRRARLQVLALAPPPGPDRDADGLVAGQDLLRLSMTPGARP